MLSIKKLGVSSQGMYYLELAQEDYYWKGGEPPGHWYGTGATVLGLHGTVSKEAFSLLLRGYSPASNPLVQSAGKPRHQPGWDLTFSCPKSVSALWAVADKEVRERLQEAHTAAVTAALGYLSAELAQTRRGKGGLSREPAQIVAARFAHGTSRAQDPQLHEHVVLLNLGVRGDGSTGTLNSLPFYQAKMALGALYRLELGDRLERDLGLRLDRETVGFSVRGISEGLIQAFSQRRTAIEKFLRENGYETAKAAERAALATRTGKEFHPRQELFTRWRELARTYGLTPERANELTGHVPRLRNALTRERRIIAVAAERLLQETGHFTKHALIREVAETAVVRGLNVDRTLGAIGDWLRSPERISLGEYQGMEHFTTRTVLAQEKEMITTAQRLQHRTGRKVTETDIARTEAHYPTLTPEQRAALHHVTRETGNIALVAGRAGTGKTTLLRAAREVWERAGYRVYGAAVAGKAAQGLQTEAGIQSETLARRFRQIAPTFCDRIGRHLRNLGRTALGKKALPRDSLSLDERSVLIVDEASMIANPQMAGLIAAIERTGAKLVLVGDAGQLGATLLFRVKRTLSRVFGHSIALLTIESGYV